MLAAKDPFVSAPAESANVRRDNFAESLGWYTSLTADLFGDGTSATATPSAVP